MVHINFNRVETESNVRVYLGLHSASLSENRGAKRWIFLSLSSTLARRQTSILNIANVSPIHPRRRRRAAPRLNVGCSNTREKISWDRYAKSTFSLLRNFFYSFEGDRQGKILQENVTSDEYIFFEIFFFVCVGKFIFNVYVCTRRFSFRVAILIKGKFRENFPFF